MILQQNRENQHYWLRLRCGHHLLQKDFQVFYSRCWLCAIMESEWLKQNQPFPRAAGRRQQVDLFPILHSGMVCAEQILTQIQCKTLTPRQIRQVLNFLSWSSDRRASQVKYEETYRLPNRLPIDCIHWNELWTRLVGYSIGIV